MKSIFTIPIGIAKLLSSGKLPELYGVHRSVITRHLKNIFESGEPIKRSTCAKFAHVQKGACDY